MRMVDRIRKNGQQVIDDFKAQDAPADLLAVVVEMNRRIVGALEFAGARRASNLRAFMAACRSGGRMLRARVGWNVRR